MAPAWHETITQGFFIDGMKTLVIFGSYFHGGRAQQFEMAVLGFARTTDGDTLDSSMWGLVHRRDFESAAAGKPAQSKPV